MAWTVASEKDAAPQPSDVELDAWLPGVLIGKTILLELPKLGASGHAMVAAIEPCPVIERAKRPGRRVITGTFRHSAGNVIDLQVVGEPDSIGVTDNHPFWSAERQEFVPAGKLHVGEQLQRADGTLTQVARITARRGPPVEVFNLEVDAEHVYHVGTTGVLVHNAHVYASIKDDVWEYVGMTNYFERRAKEHSKIREIVELPGLSSLDDVDTDLIRGIEQTLIEHFRRSRDGGTLSNIRNSISPKNEIYEEAVRRGTEFLESIDFWNSI